MVDFVSVSAQETLTAADKRSQVAVLDSVRTLGVLTESITQPAGSDSFTCTESSFLVVSGEPITASDVATLTEFPNGGYGTDSGTLSESGLVTTGQEFYVSGDSFTFADKRTQTGIGGLGETGTLTDAGTQFTGSAELKTASDSATLSEGHLLTTPAALDLAALDDGAPTELEADDATSEGTLAETVALSALNVQRFLDTGTLAESHFIQQPILASDAFALAEGNPTIITGTGTSPRDDDNGVFADTDVASIDASHTGTLDIAAVAEAPVSYAADVVASDAFTTNDFNGADPITEDKAASEGLQFDEFSVVEQTGGTPFALVEDSDLESGFFEHQPAVALAHTDTGAETERHVLTAVATGSDTGTEAEATTLTATVVSTDARSAAEAGSITATLSASDTQSASDNGALAPVITASDAGTLAETASITVSGVATNTATQDSGSLTEAPNIAATSVNAESGSETEAITLTAGASGSETGSWSEAAHIAVTVIASESATLSDVVDALLAAITSSDSGTESDTGSIAEGFDGAALGTIVVFATGEGAAHAIPLGDATVDIIPV